MMAERQRTRYRALPIASVIFRILAYVVIVVGVITAIAAPFAVVGLAAQITAVIGILLATLVQAVLYFALSDIINAILEIDENTFQTRQMMQRAEMPAAPLRAVGGETPEERRRAAEG